MKIIAMKVLSFVVVDLAEVSDFVIMYIVIN